MALEFVILKQTQLHCIMNMQFIVICYIMAIDYDYLIPN
jgi:hypothetical protein